MDTERPQLNADQRRVLSSLLDEIIPARGDVVPGAGSLGLGTYVETALDKLPALQTMISEGLSALDDQARQRFGASFWDLERADKLTLISAQGFIFPLLFQAYAGYYHHPQVVAGLGLAPRAPHPEGYAMGEDDLSLLDPVRRRGPLYRRI